MPTVGATEGFARPFVGRTRERALLGHLLREASRGRTGTIVLAGLAGIGKTALLRWLAGESAGLGGLVLQASGSEGELPYSALAQLLRPISAAGGSLPSLWSRDHTEPVDELAVISGVTTRLLSRARRNLVTVMVDDVQGIDGASQRVLEEVVASLDDAGATATIRCLTVLVARNPVDDAPLVRRALRLSGTRALELTGLDDQDVYDLLLQAGVVPNPRLVADLLEETGGLPLLLEPAIERLADPAGTLTSAPRIKTVGDALERRFERVGDDVRALLAAAAVLEQPWSPHLLASVVGAEPADIDPKLRAAAAARLVTSTAGGWRFEHPLIRSELGARLSLHQRRLIHRAAAAALLADGSASTEILLRGAHHLARAGPAADRAQVTDVCWSAGERAARSHAPELAGRLLCAAADACAGLVPPTEEVERRLAAADALYLGNDAAECERQLNAVLSSPEATPKHRLAAATVLVQERLAKSALRHGRRPRLDELELALAAADLDPSDAAEARAVLAEALYVSGERDRALDLLDDARATGGVTSGSAACRVDFAEGIHRMAGLELRHALVCFERAIEAARRADLDLLGVAASGRRGYTLLLAGDLAGAEEQLAEAQTRAEHCRFWGEASYALAVRAHIGALTGDPATTLLLDRAVQLHQRSGYTYSRILATPIEAAVAARSGRTPTRRSTDTHAGDSTTLRALAAVEQGDAVAARSALVEARWRQGFDGSASLGRLTVAAAMTLVGDLLGDPDLVRSAAAPLTAAAAAGVEVVPGWPALVARLLAVVARHEGRGADSHRQLARAGEVLKPFPKSAEGALVDLERATVLLRGGALTHEAATVLAGSISALDELDMHGWVRRAELLAEHHRLIAATAAGRQVRARTILTTDIVGSTAANVRLGDALYLEQLRIHDRIARARLAEFGGTEIKHTGDGLNAYFDASHAAIGCALAIEEDLAMWAEDEPELALHVRCGLARGRPIPSGGDLFGIVQSEAARLCALASGGEVLASAAVLDDGYPADVETTSLGSAELAGFSSPLTVFRLTRTRG